MAREHPATARSPDSFPQVSQSSAAATVGNPARATTAKHANNQYADERICIACGLRTLVGAAGIADRYSPGAHPTISRSRSSNGSSAKLVARFPVWVKMRRTHVEHIRSALAPKEAVARTLLDFAFVPITTVAEPPRQRERTASMTLRPRALAVVRLTTRSNLEARSRLGSFHQSDHAYRTCVPTFDGKWHGHHREAVVADLRQVGHELDQRQVLLHQRQVIGDPHLARIELHAAQERLLREHVDRQPRHALVRHVFGDAAPEIGPLLPEARLAPHLVGPAGVDHDDCVGTNLDPAFAGLLYRHDRARPPARP